ncbi:alpha/beta hydrolase [Streptomyces sp. LP05-1]|uniref:Alpha/beta hydrolase n=1 Tax=Streptomyces pyxinae TaxID=2970734 RepID=A0ABT2CH57_9ACTN|nr:alpha/beta hydrolase [Streptomyces sp. LP05-1]MCS0636746.1 alpha/beta hydrolase [Streptomyces sp. LP05-1]
MPTYTAPDGTARAYRVSGEGAPLVCLPGGPLRPAAYLGDLGGLSAHRRLILPDPPGAGDSAHPAGPDGYCCDRQVAEVEALRVHLGLDRFDLLAHSAAGSLALLYALAHPDRVASLTLVTGGTWCAGIPVTGQDWRDALALRPPEPWYEAARALFDENPAPGRPAPDPEAVRAALQPLMYGRWDNAARAHAESRGPAEPGADAAYFPAGSGDPAAVRAGLASLDVPVLVLVGEYDALPTPARAAELAALLPDAEVVVQPGAAHFPWVDDPAAFTRIVTAFLDPEVRTVTLGPPAGARLAYRTWGEEGAPPVVLVHARGESSRSWTGIARELAATHRVYAVDLRGHGLSDWPGGYTFERFRDDLRGFIEALGLAGADVVGHSLGGITAGLLAQECPGLIGRLVLEDAPPLLPPAALRPVAPRPEDDPGCDWDVVLDTDAQTNQPDPAWTARFPEVTAATLVVGGGPSSPVGQDRLAWLAERIPDARLVTIDAGHHVHTECPAEFLAALRDFGIGTR